MVRVLSFRAIQRLKLKEGSWIDWGRKDRPGVGSLFRWILTHGFISSQIALVQCLSCWLLLLPETQGIALRGSCSYFRRGGKTIFLISGWHDSQFPNFSWKSMSYRYENDSSVQKFLQCRSQASNFVWVRSMSEVISTPFVDWIVSMEWFDTEFISNSWGLRDRRFMMMTVMVGVYVRRRGTVCWWRRCHGGFISGCRCNFYVQFMPV